MQSRKCWTKFRFINSVSIFGTFKFMKLLRLEVSHIAKSHIANSDVRYIYMQGV